MKHGSMHQNQRWARSRTSWHKTREHAPKKAVDPSGPRVAAQGSPSSQPHMADCAAEVLTVLHASAQCLLKVLPLRPSIVLQLRSRAGLTDDNNGAARVEAVHERQQRGHDAVVDLVLLAAAHLHPANRQFPRRQGKKSPHPTARVASVGFVPCQPSCLGPALWLFTGARIAARPCQARGCSPHTWPIDSPLTLESAAVRQVHVFKPIQTSNTNSAHHLSCNMRSNSSPSGTGALLVRGGQWRSAL